jgi:hypothetical protein
LSPRTRSWVQTVARESGQFLDSCLRRNDICKRVSRNAFLKERYLYRAGKIDKGAVGAAVPAGYANVHF